MAFTHVSGHVFAILSTRMPLSRQPNADLQTSLLKIRLSMAPHPKMSFLQLAIASSQEMSLRERTSKFANHRSRHITRPNELARSKYAGAKDDARIYSVRLIDLLFDVKVKFDNRLRLRGQWEEVPVELHDRRKWPLLG